MGHSEFDRPLLGSSADNCFTQMSAEILTGARRGSECLNHIQHPESLLPQLSACPARPMPSAAQPSCRAVQLRGDGLGQE